MHFSDSSGGLTCGVGPEIGCVRTMKTQSYSLTFNRTRSNESDFYHKTTRETTKNRINDSETRGNGGYTADNATGQKFANIFVIETLNARRDGVASPADRPARPAAQRSR